MRKIKDEPKIQLQKQVIRPLTKAELHRLAGADGVEIIYEEDGVCCADCRTVK